jgi:hypothetical protein
MINSRFLIIVIFIAVSTQYAFGQSSLVPVYHQAYDWLHYQRVRGNAPLYNYEALPLTRGQITELLANIDPAKLNRGDRHVRNSYLREFSVDSLKNYKNNSVIQGSDRIYNRLKDIIFSDDEAHVYVWDDDKATIAFDWFPGRGAVFVTDGSEEYASPYYTYGGIRSYGSFSNKIGFHYEQWRAVQVGDNEAFRYIPFLSRNWKFITGEFYNKHHLNTSFGYQNGYWSLHIGRGLLKYGVGKQNNLVYSRESIPFDWVRFNINSKYIDYTLVHGFLSWHAGAPRILEGFPDTYHRTAPNRFTVHQRIQFKPTSWISFSYYELINYSNRKIELAYINPVNRLAISEWELQDQDNGFAGFEGVLRPINGLELWGEILIDDLGDKDDLFRWDKKKAINSYFARYLGLNYAFRFGTVIHSYIQRVESAVYAHKYALNAHAEKGIGLGSQIGPNGDQISIGFDQWLSHRFQFSFTYDYSRHGLNYFDENNNFVDVGGDVNNSYTVTTSKNTNFLNGDLHRWNRYTIKATYNPWRGITLNAEYSLRHMLQGEQIKDLSFFNFTFLIGY